MVERSLLQPNDGINRGGANRRPLFFVSPAAKFKLVTNATSTFAFQSLPLQVLPEGRFHRVLVSEELLKEIRILLAIATINV